MKNKILVIIFVIFISILTGCSSSMKHIEDTNGPLDYSLQTFSDDDIINSKKCVTVLSVATHNDITGAYSLSAKKLTGFETAYTARKDIIVNVNLSVEAGNYRCVVIKDNKIETDILIGETQIRLLKGDAIKICGESLKFKIDIKEQRK